MTVSPNSDYDPQRNTIITAALQLIGVLPAGQEPVAADIALAANLLEMELKALQGEGIVLRTVERKTMPLTSGVAEYALPQDTLEVQVDPQGIAGTIVSAGQGGETLVTAMASHEWLAIANKEGTQGRPTRVYIERQAVVKVIFWPVPDSSSATFRYLQVRLLRDVDTGSVTADLPSRWIKVVTYGLAVHLARAKSVVYRVTDLRGEYQTAKAAARATDVEKGPSQLHVRHGRGRR